MIGKQLIFELWGHNIEFEGFDVRFSYDGKEVTPSNINTNEPVNTNTKVDVGNQIFKFESEFENNLELSTVRYLGSTTNGLRLVLSASPPLEQNTEHMTKKDGETEEIVINTFENTLFGKLSFKMLGDEFDINKFKLEPSSEHSPITGVKVNIDGGSHHYENQSVFRFVDATASKNADLADIKLWNFEEDGVTEKVYPITPTFDKNTLEYSYELLERVDKMNLTLVKDHEKSTIKLKTPKRNENGELMFEADGTTIVYEEKQIEDLTQEITLNELGKPDTLVEIIVTAEDGKTTKTYKVSIHRPFATIRGSIQLGDGLRESIDLSEGILLEYIANITLYDPNDFEWYDVVDLNIQLSELQNCEKIDEIQSEGQNGDFEMIVIPGTYDIYLNEQGFLPIVIDDSTLNEGDVLDLGNKLLYEGDADGNGIIEVEDAVEVISRLNQNDGDPDYTRYCDFGRKGYISVEDLVCAITNKGKYITIE